MGLGAVYCLIITFMCGRTACTLARDDIVKACSFRDRRGKRRRSVWKDPPGGQQYKTSYNMAPGAFTPVIMSSKHFGSSIDQSDPGTDPVVIMPMKWGLVPQWHKDSSPSKVAFKTSNCRGESMLEKATFKIPLQKGQRCVAVMDGFYEWKTTPAGKQPYFFKFCSRDLQSQVKDEKSFKDENALCVPEYSSIVPKSEDMPLSSHDFEKFKVEKKETKVEPLTAYTYNEKKPQSNICNRAEQSRDGKDTLGVSSVKQECSSSSGSGCSHAYIGKKNVCSDLDLAQQADDGSETSWSGQKLLTCAAVYDVWKPSHASSALYSYSIITVAASTDMSWCHHRMPAVLTTDEEICDWLDYSTIPLSKANSLIQPKSNCLTSHPVSKSVNNSNYQSQDCLKPVDLCEEKKKLSGSGQMMMNWLKRGQSSSATDATSAAKSAKM